MMATASLALAACVAIGANSDQVLAGDLATAVPAFANLPSDTALGWAPAPGAPRLLHRAELRRLASRLGIEVEHASDLCVERPVAPLDRGRLLAAMRSRLPNAEMDLVDFSRQPAPQGEYEFPLSGLRRHASAAYWNGWVRYAGNRRFAIWARVRITTPVVLAVEDLTAGRPIRANQVVLETRSDGTAVEGVANLNGVIGKLPQRTIRAGTAIPANALAAPPAVRRGDAVTVTVECGGAHLKLETQAETTARVGERIALRNPVSHRRFWARVAGPGRASVERERP